MKKQYKTPVVSFTVPSFDLDFMVPITPSHGSAPGGLAKERDDESFPNDEDMAIIQLQMDQEEGNTGSLW